MSFSLLFLRHFSEGNVRLRKLVRQILPKYEQAPSKQAKTCVVAELVDSIRRNGRRQEDGGFVRKDLLSGRWIEIGSRKAREKVGHIIRIELRKKRSKEGGRDHNHDHDQPELPTSSFCISRVASTKRNYSDTHIDSEAAMLGNTIMIKSYDPESFATSTLLLQSLTSFSTVKSSDDKKGQKCNLYHIPRNLTPPSHLMGTTTSIGALNSHQNNIHASSSARSHHHHHHPDDAKVSLRLLPLPDHVTVRESQHCRPLSLDVHKNDEVGKNGIGAIPKHLQYDERN